jgi:hypothetical protein
VIAEVGVGATPTPPLPPPLLPPPLPPPPLPPPPPPFSTAPAWCTLRAEPARRSAAPMQSGSRRIDEKPPMPRPARAAPAAPVAAPAAREDARERQASSDISPTAKFPVMPKPNKPKVLSF